MSNIPSYKVLMFPIRFFLCFLIFTEFLFFVGPIDFKIPSPVLLIIFFLATNIALYKGYKSGLKYYSFGQKNILTNFNYKYTLQSIIVIALLMLIPRLMSAWGVSIITPGVIIEKVTSGLNSPMEVYAEKLESETGTLSYFNMLMAPITFMAIPLGVFYWKNISAFFKVIVLFIICMEIFIWIGVGTRKGILDLFLILFFVLISKTTGFIDNLSKYKKYFFAGSFVLVLFLYYFIYSNLSRYSVDNLGDLESLLDMKIKPVYIEYVPTSVYMIIYSIEGYLCQGYYALGNAFFSDFCFSFGLGSSWFTVNLVEKFGIDILPYTYQGALERELGIDPMINWHSIYVWLANDFTFLGVPFIIYLVGKYFAKLWLDTITSRSFYAPALFSLFVLMIFYFFANNQVFSFSFIPFVVLFILWKFKLNINQ